MTVYTGYFAQTKKYINMGLIPVSIARFAPKWFPGERLHVFAPTVELLESYKLGKCTKDEYTKEYIAFLKENDNGNLDNYLKDGMVLCCYEKSGAFCHRHILSEYLRQEYGIEIREVVI